MEAFPSDVLLHQPHRKNGAQGYFPESVMTQEEEQKWWHQMVTELRQKLTIEEFAEHLDVTERTICNWQNGERPLGMKALRVYLLHVKLCSAVHRSAIPSN